MFTCACTCVGSAMLGGWDYACRFPWGDVLLLTESLSSSYGCWGWFFFFVCFFATLHLFLSLTVSKWIADLGTAEKHPICFTTKASNVTRGLRADRLGERDEKKEKHRERRGLLSGGNDGDKKEKKMGEEGFWEKDWDKMGKDECKRPGKHERITRLREL